MRNLLIFMLPVLLSALHANAQNISYNADDLANIGDIFNTRSIVYDTADWVPADSVDPALWNFSTIEPDSTDTVEIMSKNDFDELEELPDSTMVMPDNDGYLCLHLDNDTLNMLGILADMGGQMMPMIFPEPQPMLHFPLTIGEGSEESLEFPIEGTPEDFNMDSIDVDSLRFVIDITASTYVEDTGNVSTFQYEYQAFKVSNSTILSVDVWAKIWGMWTPIQEDAVSDSTRSIQFYNPEYGIPVVEVEMSWNNDIRSYEMIDEPGNAIAFAQKQDIEIYPNPAQNSEVIHFSHRLSNIKIYNISGRLVQQNSAQTKHLALEDLEQGCYLIFAAETPRAIRLLVY